MRVRARHARGREKCVGKYARLGGASSGAYRMHCITVLF